MRKFSQVFSPSVAPEPLHGASYSLSPQWRTQCNRQGQEWHLSPRKDSLRTSWSLPGLLIIVTCKGSTQVKGQQGPGGACLRQGTRAYLTAGFRASPTWPPAKTSLQSTFQRWAAVPGFPSHLSLFSLWFLFT